jgi:hypothetical protein
MPNVAGSHNYRKVALSELSAEHLCRLVKAVTRDSLLTHALGKKLGTFGFSAAKKKKRKPAPKK